MHLSGAVYAETFLREAGEDGLCVDPTALRLAQPPCTGQLLPAAQLSGNITAANQALYNRLIDAFSMRGFVPSSGWSGHDQFFAAFRRFSGLSKTHIPEWVDEIASRAAAQNNQYLELMETPPFVHAALLAHEIGWSADLEQADPQAFAMFRRQLLDKGLRAEVAAGLDDARQAEDGRKQRERCGTPQAAPACQVEVRYLYQVLRGNAPEKVFAQALLAFETVEASMDAKDDLWVGINFVAPEDGLVAMRDYTLQMKMIGFLHSVYPNVPISLHAGELAFGLVPPEGLRFHIRQAVELGHAERIGHGVDLMEEDDPKGLLKELAQKHVMIEINLSSNEAILGVKGAEHPFPDLSRGEGSGGALDRRRGSEPHRPDERIRARGAGLRPELRGPEATGADGHGARFFARREFVGQAGRFCGAGEGLRRSGAGRRETVSRVQGLPGRQREGCGAVGAGAPVPGVRGEVLTDNERIRVAVRFLALARLFNFLA